MGAVHRLDRDFHARHHECEACRRARAEPADANASCARSYAGQALMSTRIDKRFATLREDGRAALVTFMTAGDPDQATSLALLQALTAAGADIIELGMPFTDPMADGRAIQVSSQRALKRGQTLAKTLDLVRTWRKSGDCTPL